MGATQITSGQLRVGHVNKWLAVRPFNESRNLSNRTIYQTTNLSISLRSPGQVQGRPTGIHPVSPQALTADDSTEFKKQPQTASQLVFTQDFAAVVPDPKQLMNDLASCGWIDGHGIVSESFYDLSDHAKMGLPESYSPVSDKIFGLLQAARRNYYILGYDVVMGEHRADNPLSFFGALDGLFSMQDHVAVHSAWTAKNGEMRHSLLSYILSAETPSVDPAEAISRMNSWFKDTNHCPIWAPPGQPPVFHSYDFELAQESGMAPHTDLPVGGNVIRTHHFKLASEYLADIAKGLENIGQTIGKRVNVKLPDNSRFRLWTHSSHVDFVLHVLENARFGTPNIQQDSTV